MKRLFPLLALLGLMFTACDKGANNNNDEGVSYNLGDVVTIDGVKGVVFYKDDVVTKIVSVDEVHLAWSTEYIATNAIDLCDGAINMATIKEIDGWEEKYPAFKWCADYGKDWYLPAQSELLEIYNQRAVINAALQENGYTKLDVGDNVFYWSSSEATRVAASGIFLNSGKEYNYIKSSTHNLRAILAI